MASAGSIFVDLLLRDAQYKRGLDRSRRQTRSWSNSTKKDANSFSSALSGVTGGLTKMASVAGAAFSFVALSRAADRVSELEGRLRLSTRTTEEFETAFAGLADQSVRFGSGLEAGTTVFQRLSFVRQELTATVDEMLQFTETVQALGIASGASGAALTSGLTQLGQGLSSSILRAEEFNSIMENIPAVGAAIAEEFGVTTGQLRQLVISGEVLSQDVFAAILNYTERANEQFEQMPLTISRAMSSFSAQLDIVARNLIGVSGANESIANSIAFATERLEEMGFFAYVIVEAFEALGVAAKQAFNDAAVAFRDFYNEYSEAIRKGTFGQIDLGIITSIFDIQYKNPNAAKTIEEFAKEYGGIFEKEISRTNREISQDYAEIAKTLSSGDTKEADKKLRELMSSYDKYESLIKGVTQSQIEYGREEEEIGKLYRENIITLDQYYTALSGLDDKYDESKEKAKVWAFSIEDAAEQASKNIQSTFADFLFDPFEDGLDGMLMGFANTLRRMAAEAASVQILSALFGEDGFSFGSQKTSSSNDTGFLGKLFDGFFADGGFIQPGHFGIAGEAGAEIVMGGRSGATVIPMGGAGGVTVNVINNTPANVSTQERQGANGMELMVMIDESVAKNIKTPGTRTNQALGSFAGRTMVKR